MSWTKWKMGLVVAGLSALCDGVIVLLAAPDIAWKGLGIALAVMMAKAVGLYLKQHPVEGVVTETEILRKAAIEAGKGNIEHRTSSIDHRILGILLVGVLCLGTGCANGGAMLRALAKDPATVVVRVGTPWGMQQFTRIGGVTNTVSVSPDGAVTIVPVVPKKSGGE